ncbi:B3 domain-containing protein LFL1-like isoform X2 [Dioscorea cayenensis subsp. rotundata]|uniref:B3 domain-containing protein LFL1-like isoform X2 n=1 Tax=Dioscorea cayennensis subsp. rotundata TaxID=55577 RepID=A0AB40AR05_DIOCR|nr:B3 domain-containing protein LFL1-like isoform X2 [Dioscorea cayenensis subsp. rotundata]
MDAMRPSAESSEMDINERQFLHRIKIADAKRANASAMAADRTDPFQNVDGLRFVLQKELKNSDVGSLGRIVLPKREAETRLPSLVARGGISLMMEDIHTKQVWAFKYRFWPNNKSRMYILENAGDFIKKHGLQPGDVIMIYKNEEKDGFIKVIRAKKEIHQEPSANADYDGVFDTIVPEIPAPTVRYSELFQPCSDGVYPGYDLNCAFLSDFSMGYQDE